MSLNAQVALEVGSLHLDVELAASSTEIIALVGPNGAGKSTFLRALAGLAQVREGRVDLDGAILDDTAESIHVAPEHRPIAVVFQDYLLFPHLSAQDNVAYGMRARGATRNAARRDALSWLERVGLAEHAGSRPAALSGGQSQRVALARALATRPSLLLLDEPLAAIDVSARSSLRRDLRAHLAEAEGVRIIVTHDPLDAMAMADRLVVLEDGRVTQQGTLGEVTARPRSRWAAQLVGLNLYRGEVAGNALTMVGGHRLQVLTDIEGPAFALVHPRAVSLHRDRPGGSARNVWQGDLDGIDFEGDRVRVRMRGPLDIVAEVTPQASAELRLADGGPAWVTVKATEIDVYPT